MKKIPWAFLLTVVFFIVYFSVFIFPSFQNSSEAFTEGPTSIQQGDPSIPFRAKISIVPPKLDDKDQYIALELHEASFFVAATDYDKRIAKVCIDSMAVIIRFQDSFGGIGEQIS